MGEETKSVILDILKSDEMKDYFRELLTEQTIELVSAIDSVEKKKNNKEICELNDKISQARKVQNNMERQLSNLESVKLNMESILNEKNAEISQLSDTLRKIEQENGDLRTSNEQLTSKLLDERGKNKEIKSNLEAEKRNISEKLKEYERNFVDAYALYNYYKSLPISLKQRISNIFVSENVYSMITVSSDWNCIEGLWGFTKRRIIEDENEGLCELVCLFSKSFELYSVVDGSGRYKLISPCVGDKFDSDRHSIKGIKTDGTIEKVLLDGIYDSISKKTVFKAVVQVL